MAFKGNFLHSWDKLSSNNLEELIETEKRVNNNGNQESIHCDFNKGSEDVFQRYFGFKVNSESDSGNEKECNLEVPMHLLFGKLAEQWFQ